MDLLINISRQVPGDPKKSIPLFGVSEGTQVFAKQLNKHIFGFPTKNLTISDQYFQRFHCRKKIFVIVQYFAQLRYYKYFL